MSWAEPGLSGPVRALCPRSAPQFDQALVGPELASDTHRTKDLFEKPGSEELGFICAGFCGTTGGQRSQSHGLSQTSVTVLSLTSL